jgi:natural product precursor
MKKSKELKELKDLKFEELNSSDMESTKGGHDKYWYYAVVNNVIDGRLGRAWDILVGN